MGDKIGRFGSGAYAGMAQPGSTLDLWYEKVLFNGVAMDWFDHSGQSHNCIWRGKYLGDTFTEAQKIAIADGTFDDMYVGDYWTINGVDWVIADIDYYYGLGDTACWTHHLVIVPRTTLGSAQMNATATTTGGYLNSAMRTTILKCDSTTASDTRTTYGEICAAFGESYILSHRLVLSNAIDANGNASSWEWTDSKVDLLNQSQIFGQKTWVNGTNDGFNVGIQTTQLAGFRLNHNFIIVGDPTARTSYWTSDVRTATFFVYIVGRGNAANIGANGLYGVRPHFCLYGGTYN